MTLLAGTFQIKGFDETCSKYYDCIRRVMLESPDHSIKVVLDYNYELYPALKAHAQSVELRFVTQLNVDAESIRADDASYNPRLPELLERGVPGLNYAMHGTVFEFKGEEDRVSIYISFGGLICKLTAPQSVATEFRFGMKLYLLCCNTL